MQISKLLPILLMPNIAMAKGGGSLVMGIIFLPILIWIIIKIWSFWFRLIFGGSNRESLRSQQSKSLVSRSMKECPYCAELILIQAKKCKHCGSSLV